MSERAERDRADRAIAAAAEIGSVLDVIERNLGATKYPTIYDAEQDIRDLIRVGRENARQCYRGDLPQLVTAMNEIRMLRGEVARISARRDEAEEAAGTYAGSWEKAQSNLRSLACAVGNLIFEWDADDADDDPTGDITRIENAAGTLRKVFADLNRHSAFK